MGWQEAGVALIVAAAVAFLVRKVFVRPRQKPAEAFIPLGKVKSKDNADCCH
jgi:hypothetical protein